MRFPLILYAFVATVHGAVPADLAAALKTFRTDAPRGWSFTQSTEADGKSRIERYDAGKPEFDRWTLLKQNNQAPNDDEQLDYKQKLIRRPGKGSAPLLTDQLDLTNPEKVSDTGDRASYRVRLKAGEAGDKTAEFMLVALTVHKPTHTIESLEIFSSGEFTPTWGVTISEMKTTMTYSLPSGDAPSLPQKVTTRLRGRAFLVKSLDADMIVDYADYAKAGKK